MSNIIYVNVNASGNNDGSSWENAYNNLQDALNSAVAEDRVWVADGTYLPSTTNNRETSFAIPSNVKVYGGFTGGEAELSQRNPQQNITTLSGDLGISGDNTDNSFNVVTLNEVESETLLDGFTIAQGNADGDGDISNLANNAGGGIYAENSSATLNNLIVTDNNASRGGGMFSNNGNHQITNVRFVGNSAGALLGGVGGGLSTANGTETLENVAFVNNTANAGNGGAIDNNRSNLELNNLEFIANQAGNYGGAIHNSFDDRTSFNLTNSVFLHNTASGNNSIGNTRISSGYRVHTS